MQYAPHQDNMEQENQLPQVPNFRDVGKTVNQFLGERSANPQHPIRTQAVSPSTNKPSRRIREGLFYRSGRLGTKISEKPQISL